MKILILSDDFPPKSFGGAGLVAGEQARALKEVGNDVCVITTTRERYADEYYDYNGITVYSIYSDYHERWRAYVSLLNPPALFRIKKIINDFGPDVVHAHNIHRYLSYYSLILAKKSGAKVFLTAHDTMSFSYGKFFQKVGFLFKILLKHLILMTKKLQR